MPLRIPVRSPPRLLVHAAPGAKYLSKISGPLLDRIDLHVEVPAVPSRSSPRCPAATLCRLPCPGARGTCPPVQAVGHKGPLVNGRMTPRQLRKLCTLKPEAMSILKAAMEESGLSARAHDKVLRVARTIADLECTDEIQPPPHCRGRGVQVA